MPKLTLLLNIGTADAEKLGLDHPEETREGATISVTQKVADEMLKRGWAVAEGEDARAVSARNPAEPQPQATAAPAGIPVAITERPGTAKAKAAPRGAGGVPSGEEPDADASPVSTDNAPDAIDQISRMKSPEKLKAIADNDPRATVKAAAQKRLGEL